MILPIVVAELIILKYFSRNNNSVSISQLKRDTISEIKDINDVIASLRDKDYVLLNETNVSLTEKAILFINDYDKIGSEYIFKDELDLAILFFMNNLNAPLSSKWFPLLIQEKAPITDMSQPNEGYHLYNYIIYKSGIKNYIDFINNNFSLKPSGKNYFQSVIIQEKKKVETEDLQYAHLDYSVQELEKKLSDYDNVQKRGRDAIFISKVSISLSILIPLILQLLKWKCNVP